ncbi:MAG: dTDP-4-amino-4,6-dideoxygalactose transaminase [Planctomycetes bacterium]|nr:dTDP-4-amino-4,6-dideoxygalactose transaminase [Planctomycetota bacterium]
MTAEIPFNRPFIAGKELFYVARAVTLGNIAGDGHFTRECSREFQQRFGIHKVLMTPSCTAALEMAMMLLDVGPGDEVIVPSFTFVSTANAIVQRGAKPVFADVRPDTLNMDETLVEGLITDNTKAVLPVHYAGVSAEMDTICEIGRRRGVAVVEDAAQGVHAYYKGRALGSIGELGTYSFHETKNYTCGEGGALCINDASFMERAEIIRDKGTNRSKFFRGEVDKYTWVDVGSSYVPTEIACAFLYAQIELLEEIAQRRRKIWETYYELLESFETRGLLRRPIVPEHCQSNYHMFYVLFQDGDTRDEMITHLRTLGVRAVFHYLPLHDSPMGNKLGYAAGDLPVTEDCSKRLLRLPLFYDITPADQQRVVDGIESYFAGQGR